jgi:hypothetical protein
MELGKLRIECYSRISAKNKRHFIGTDYRNRADKSFSEDASGARLQGTIPDPSDQLAGGGEPGKTRHGPITIRLSETVHLPRKALKPPFRKVNVTMSKHQKIRCGVFNCGRKSN